MKRFTLMLCCLTVICSLGFWRLMTTPEPFIQAQGRASVQESEKFRHEEIDWGKKHLLQMHEHAERREHRFEEAERKRDHLLEAAENLMHAGKPELAERLHHEAEEIERHLQKARQSEHGHPPHGSLEPIVHELHGLRKEVVELREQIHELREVIEHAIEEHGDEAEEKPAK